MELPFFRKFAQSAKTSDKKLIFDEIRAQREQKNPPSSVNWRGESCATGYFVYFCMKRIRIDATSARVALPCGASVVAVRPLIRPALTAQRIASVAQLETLEASV